MTDRGEPFDTLDQLAHVIAAAAAAVQQNAQLLAQLDQPNGRDHEPKR